MFERIFKINLKIPILFQMLRDKSKNDKLIRMKKTKEIVEAGLFVAIYAVLFLVSNLTGMALENTLFFILPLPIIVLSIKYDLKLGLIAFISTLIIGFLINPISMLANFLPAGILGLIYSLMIKKNIKPTYRLILCILVTVIVNILTMVIFADLFDYSLTGEIKELLSLILKLFIKDTSTFNYDLLVIWFIPLFIILLSVLEGYIIDFLSSFVLARLKIEHQRSKVFTLIDLPEILPILYVVFLVLFIIFNSTLLNSDQMILNIIGGILFNLVVMFSVIFSMYGFIGLTFIIKKRIISLIIFMGLMIFLTIPCLLLFSIIGCVYILFPSLFIK